MSSQNKDDAGKKEYFIFSVSIHEESEVSSMSPGSGPQVLPVWGLAIPLPAVLMITLGIYMMVLGVGLWIRFWLKVGAADSVTVTHRQGGLSFITLCKM